MSWFSGIAYDLERGRSFSGYQPHPGTATKKIVLIISVLTIVSFSGLHLRLLNS